MLVYASPRRARPLGVPMKLSETPDAADRAAPLLGQNTEEILIELGYTETERRGREGQGRRSTLAETRREGQ